MLLPRIVTHMWLQECHLLGPRSLVIGKSRPVMYGPAMLAAKFKFRQYEFARPGDYIGLIRRDRHIVDFFLPCGHRIIQDPDWRARVVEIMRVESVGVQQIGATHGT